MRNIKNNMKENCNREIEYNKEFQMTYYIYTSSLLSAKKCDEAFFFNGSAITW